jgi:hypothetical protein
MQICGCSKRLVDPNEVSYMIGGVSFCLLSCMQEYQANQARKQRARQAQAMHEGGPRISCEHFDVVG